MNALSINYQSQSPPSSPHRKQADPQQQESHNKITQTA